MSTGRPLEYNPDTALEAAMQLFWRKGYESSSLQELLNTMQLSKSSFYLGFTSKHHLFEQAILHYRHQLVSNLTSTLNQSASGKQFIETLLQSVANETDGPDARRGCLLMNTAIEFAQTDQPIARLVSDSFKQLTEIFEMAIRRAKQEGDISPKTDTSSLANFLLSSIGGLRNMVKAGTDRKTIDNIVTTTLSVLV